MLAIIIVAPALAQAVTVTDHAQVPIDLLVFIPCAAGGAGEYVDLTGTLHLLFVTVIDDQGGFYSKVHFQPQGITGNGFTTGVKYQGTGVTQETFNGKIGFTDTLVNNFKMIGQGPGNNFLVHEEFHVTLSPNGQVTVFVDHISIICKPVSYP